MAIDGSTIAAATTGTFAAGVFTDVFSLTNTIDVDMVAITLEAGISYQIDVDNGNSGDLHLRIFDVFGSEVRANDDGFRTDDDVVFSLSPFFDFTPNYSGTYYVAISPYYLQGYDPFTSLGRPSPENPIGVTPGSLTITASASSPWASAGSINAVTTEGFSDKTDALREEDGSHRVVFSGAIENPTDIDLARIDLQKGDLVVVDVNGLEGNGTVLRVFTGAGTVIGLDDDTGTGEDPELIFAATTGASFFVGISGEGNQIYNAVDGTGAVAGTLGAYDVIFHRNPTQVLTSASNVGTGNAAANYIVGLGGNDTITGNDGHDTLAGGDDQDSLSGGDGNDVIYGEQGNDTLAGDRDSDVLSGGLGNDTLNGGTGIDSLAGGVGDDSLLGGAGSSGDSLSGDDGNDTLNGEAGGDLLFGGNGTDSLLGGTSTDQLDGGAGDDSLFGGNNNDTLRGGADNDTLNGDAHNDQLFGDAGNDSLSGGTGNDTLTGGAGNDSLNGGALGIDTFDFDLITEGIDIVEDFRLGFDRIDLSTIFASTGSVVTPANLAQFLQVTPAGAGADSFLAIDADGLTGGLAFTIIAQINAVTTLQLFDADNFIL